MQSGVIGINPSREDPKVHLTSQTAAHREIPPRSTPDPIDRFTEH